MVFLPGDSYVPGARHPLMVRVRESMSVALTEVALPGVLTSRWRMEQLVAFCSVLWRLRCGSGTHVWYVAPRSREG